MRTLLLGDIVAVSRALMAVPDEQRPDFLKTMIWQSEAAHRFHKRMRYPHPKWGNGSLMARANTEPQINEPCVSNTDYMRTLHLVLGVLLQHRCTTYGA